MSREGGVTFEKKFGQRSRFAGLEFVGANISFINQLPAARADDTANRLAGLCMIVTDPAETVGQTKASRTQEHAKRIREQLGQEINAGLAAMADVSANVEKFMGSNRLEKA